MKRVELPPADASARLVMMPTGEKYLETTFRKRNNTDQQHRTISNSNDQLVRFSKMARQRKEKKAKDIKLRQPDRSGPSEKTLLQLAEEMKLFKQADARQRKNRRQEEAQEEEEEEEDKEDREEGDEDSQDDDGLSPTTERVMECLLYSVCLAMLHFTLDVLVQRQYGEVIDWYNIVERATQALMGACTHSLLPSFFSSPPVADSLNHLPFQCLPP